MYICGMEAKELRMGNWVDAEYSHWIKVSILDLVNIESNPESFYPIPLTPKILEKCGWVENKEMMFTFILPNGYFTCIPQPSANAFIIKYKNDHIAKIKYLHQLQNLYFALTGEELEVKL